MNETILITGANAPAARSMIAALAHDSVTLLVCDCGIEPIASIPANQNFSVHRSDGPEFVGDLITLCVNEDVDVIVPMRANDQLALARVTRLFDGLGARVWLAPIVEHATRSQARRILQFGARARTRTPVGTWLRRVSGLASQSRSA